MKLKYRNVKVVVDGLKFDSKKEGRRWQDLKLLEKAGEISDLQRQVKYPIDINGIHVCNYFADFVYLELVEVADKKSGLCKSRLIVEDVKNPYNRKHDSTYILKKKLIKAVYGISLLET